ncbi:hypothetical protein [Streptomyces sp. CAS3]
MNGQNQKDTSTTPPTCRPPQLDWHHPPFPGPGMFGPGRTNSWILMVRLRLIILGYAKNEGITLSKDPELIRAKTWNDQLRISYTRFQLALGLRGARVNGYPGHDTWQQLWK